MAGFLICIFIGVPCLIVWLYLDHEAKKKKLYADYLKSLQNGLDHVKVLGTRTGTNSIVVGNTTYNINGTVYSLLLVYKDGRKETKEVRQEDMTVFSQYIEG